MKKLFSTHCSDTSFSIATFILRVGAGTLMMVNHGWGKLIDFADKANKFADPFGIGSQASLSLTVFAEFFCAAFIILGLFTRLATIPLIICMGVALFYAHNGELFGKGESAAMYLTCFLAILLFGPGKFSIDKLISK